MKKLKILLYLSLISAGIGVALLLYYSVIIIDHWGGITNLSLKVINNHILNQFRNNIGDFLWGTLGVLFTIPTAIFLFITFYQQKQQIESARADADRHRFETSFYNLLGMLNQVQDNVNMNINTSFRGSSIKDLAGYYRHFKESYDSHLKNDHNLISIETEFSAINANDAAIEQCQGLLATEFETFVEETKCNVGFFFRYIYNVIAFVLDNVKDTKDRTLYLNLLQAQLSNEEMGLIFYDAISKYGRNKENNLKFQELLDQTNFLENLDVSFLLARHHYVFYPHTSFKFLHRDELAMVKKVQI